MKTRTLILAVLTSYSAAANAPALLPNSSYGFMENKGQIHDQNYQPNPEVKYLLVTSNGLNVQLKKNSFSYDTYRIEEKDNPDHKGLSGFDRMRYKKDEEVKKERIYHFHRIDVDLLDANPNPEMIAQEPGSDYLNFYNAVTPECGATFVRKYKKVTYKNIYPGIDLEFLAESDNKANELKPKYNFIVHPGADISRIKIRYKGATRSYLEKGKIILELEQGKLSENIPASWFAGSQQTAEVRYRKIEQSDNSLTVGFSGPPVFTSSLIIDPVPNLIWGTYYGGSGGDLGIGISTDGSGNVLVTGYTWSNNNISTSGAHQTAYGGGTWDAFIVKFNASGVRQWGTYYGGSNYDEGWGISTDGSGNVLVTGGTNSPSAISTPGAHQTAFGGIYDAFIVKFDSNGVRQWGTYYGGSGGDRGWGISTDGSGNVLVTGDTDSPNSIATSGAHQTAHGGGLNDAFIVKFNNTGVRQWGTYYGGSGYDGGGGISTDVSGNVLVTGWTESTTAIATAGAHQTVFGGFRDAFIVKFNAGGVRQWGTYYGGSGDDVGFGISTDGSGNVFVTGSTWSTSAISTSGAHQTALGGSTDAFVAKFGGGPVGISEQDITSSVQVYSNPNSGEFIIATEKPGVFELMDINGKIINVYTVKKQTVRISERLASGMYLLRERKSGKTLKIIINE